MLIAICVLWEEEFISLAEEKWGVLQEENFLSLEEEKQQFFGKKNWTSLREDWFWSIRESPSVKNWKYARKDSSNLWREFKKLESNKSKGAHRTVSSINTNMYSNCERKSLSLHKIIGVCIIWSVLIRFIF